MKYSKEMSMAKTFYTFILANFCLFSNFTYSEVTPSLSEVSAQISETIIRGSVQRRDSNGAKIVIKCVDSRCATIVFAEVVGKKITSLNNKDFTVAEFEAAIDSIICSVRENPIFFEYTRKYALETFNYIYRESSNLLLLSGGPFGFFVAGLHALSMGVPLDASYGVVKNTIIRANNQIDKNKMRYVFNSKQTNYILPSDKYDDLRKAIVEL